VVLHRFGYKVLWFCLFAWISLMTFTTTDAQAKGHWVITPPPDVIAEEEGSDFVLLSTFGAAKTPIAILCGRIAIDESELLFEGSSTATILFYTCQTEISGLLKTNCKPLEPITTKVKNLLLHHNSDTYVLISPNSGTIFVTLHLGELCAAGEEVEVTGHAVAECGAILGSLWHHEDCSTEKVVHEIRQAPVELFPKHGLNFGSKTASFDGEGKLSLTGENLGARWAALATL
jgi:hypothetical protein